MFDQAAQLFADNAVPVKIALIIGVTLVLSLLTRAVPKIFHHRFSSTETPYDDVFASAIGAPLRLMIWLIGIGLVFEAAGAAADAPLAKMVASIRDVGVIAAIAWFLIRFINYGQKNLIARKVKKGERIDKTALDSISKLLRLMVFISAALMGLQTLGFSIAGVMTFGGIGGIAIGFAAKDMLANFFGGLMLYLDRPFSIGDWIRSPDREIEGIVEEIGWRMSLIRTLESRALYIPNSSFSTIAIENISRMTNRRIYETIGIRYEDAGAVDAIVEQVTAYLRGHDGIDQNQTLSVSFTAFAPSALNFFIYCFTKTTAGVEYYNIKQEVMLHILQIIERNGAECAFPTTTIHMRSGEIKSNGDKSN